MKSRSFTRIMACCISILPFASGYAQNVGIGTATPAQKLDIQGSGNQFVRIHSTSAGASQSGIELLRANEFSGTDWKITNDGGVLRIYDGLDNFLTAGNLNMTITQGGNVGLGANAPLRKLDVHGSPDQFLRLHTTSAGASQSGIELLRANEFSGTDWKIVNEGGVLRFYDGLHNFTSGGGQLNMSILQGGSVGIGIASPQTALHVVGSSLVNETGEGYMQVGNPDQLHLRFDNNEILARNADNPSTLYLQYWSGNLSLCDQQNGRVGVGTSVPNAKLHVTDGADITLAGGGELVLGPAAGVNLGLDGNEIQARNNGQAATLFLQNSGGDLLLVPNEAGQVGIGVLSSANMPADDYLLAVDGKIISEEVRVQVSGLWPDYVFAPGYAMPALEELEQHIRLHRHLPGMPPAATVEAEGFDLGGM